LIDVCFVKKNTVKGQLGVNISSIFLTKHTVAPAVNMWKLLIHAVYRNVYVIIHMLSGWGIV
jgi:hypothetical protein